MGARNFSTGNASKIYTMFFPTEEPILDECGNETEEVVYEHPESWEIEEGIESIKNLLTELPYSDFELSKNNTDIIGLRANKYYGDVEVGVEILCFLEHGYHEGARLDWKINFLIDSSEYDNEINLSNIKTEFAYCSELTRGMQSILSKKALAWMEKTKAEMIGKVEDVYEQVSDID